MSELKADNTFVFGEECLAYKKEDADKVIAELKEKHKTEVKELLCLIRDKENNFNRAFDSEEKEIRHQKHKRCLAMADLCDEKHCRIAADVDDGYDTDKEYRQFMSNFWIAWKCKWLDLAENFKPEGK